MSVLRSMALFLCLILWPSFVFSATPPTCASIAEVKDKYFAQNQYNEFIDELNSYKDKDKLIQPCIDYYKALGRYQQLKYLEEKQSWDDYFANGNTYREQILENANKVIDQVANTDPLKPKSMLLLWQFHHDQQDVLTEQALVDLMKELNVYAKEANDIELIKETADKLLTYEEKSSARLAYKLYVDKLVASQITEPQLKKVAADFYKEGNLELAMSVYDVYVEKISKSLILEKFIGELFEIASLFVYKAQGFFDMAFAEKIYSRIEGLGQKDSFNQETIYLRALNLEKMHAYKDAAKFYLSLTQLYPETKHFEEAIYKIAMISAYASADINEAKKYFEILAAKTVFTSHVISSLYQLGLLTQWQGDLIKANMYYDLLLRNVQGKYAAIVALTKERIKEIQETKPISYNLKTFLDLSLKNESSLIESNSAELRSDKYILENKQNANISSLVNMPQSGCNQIQLQYIWSGDLGGANPTVMESNFQGTYVDLGTKEINIVIISPAGAIDRSFIMVDVY